jgi:hypothetical protein
MPYTYPPAAPTISGDNVTISRFLNNPTLVARRLRTLLEQRYIADSLLSGRFDVSGGAVTYETGEAIGTGDNPRAVSPAWSTRSPTRRPAPRRSRRRSSGARTPWSPTSRSSVVRWTRSTGR